MQVFPLYPNYHEANCYIAACEDTCGVCGNVCAVIDPGDNAERIYKRAENNGLTIEKIILTHAHFDHIMAVNQLVRLTNAEVFIHKGDLQALYEPGLNLSGLGTGHDYSINQEVKVTPISDGDKIIVGSECLTVISTPGHTPGSACFVCGNIIFTGDTLFGSNIGRTDFPGGNIVQMKKSLARLRDLEGDFTLYPGHSGETTLSREREHNYYLFPEFCGK